MECNICKNLIIKKAILNGCWHTFCSICIQKWTKYNPKKTCPLCRKHFDDFIIRNIDDLEYENKLFTNTLLSYNNIPKEEFSIIINKQYNEGKTSLMIASYYNYKTIAAILLIQGAKVDILDDNNASALFWAGNKGNFDIFTMILNASKNGKYINEITKYGFNILHFLVAKNNILAVSQLKKHADVDLSVKDKNGDTPLDIAYKFNHLDLIHILQQP